MLLRQGMTVKKRDGRGDVVLLNRAVKPVRIKLGSTKPNSRKNEQGRQ